MILKQKCSTLRAIPGLHATKMRVFEGCGSLVGRTRKGLRKLMLMVQDVRVPIQKGRFQVSETSLIALLCFHVNTISPVLRHRPTDYFCLISQLVQMWTRRQCYPQSVPPLQSPKRKYEDYPFPNVYQVNVSSRLFGVYLHLLLARRYRKG